MPDASIAHAFVARSRHHLMRDFLPKIAACLERLDEDDLWWRPNPASNSVGNLLLHLTGNARQWIVAGVGGAPDTRRRPQEFDADRTYAAAELLASLRATLAEVDAALARLAPAELLERRQIQGFDVSVLEAVYHVVEHFSMHTGQIILLTKLRTGVDLRFYAHSPDGRVRPRWPGASDD